MSNRSLIIHHRLMLQHLTGEMHPESPARYREVMAELQLQGLLSDQTSMAAPKAPLDAIALCHTQDYIALVKHECMNAAAEGHENGEVVLSTGDVHISPESFDVALHASGAVIAAVDAIYMNRYKRVFCCVRPPGHHACSDRGMGFCIFNNVAIGARYAAAKYGIKRIAILDWDVHHGNGTEEIFQADPSVFYFSTHQEGIYPGTGAATDVGCGNIMNIPIKQGFLANTQVLAAFDSPLGEALQKFRPELIIISAGFDAHIRDPLGGLNLQDEDFKKLTERVMELANVHCEGRIISVLEGGYDLEALPSSVALHVKTLGNN